MDKFKIKAIRDYIEEPVFVKPTEGAVSDSLRAVVDEHGRIYPAQKMDDGALIILTANEDDVVTLTGTDGSNLPEITLSPASSSIGVYYGGKFFTSYCFDSVLPKPFLGPVINEAGLSYTRLDPTTTEHPHHRSVFSGIGDVRLVNAVEESDAYKGVDFWNEPKNRGVQKQQCIAAIAAGTAYATFTSELVWESADGAPMMDEFRTYTFYGQSERGRYVDITMVFTAAYGEVMFDATKEAGPLGIRVEDGMRADRGGIMTNTYGARGEAQCWGRSAQWCDYTGVSRPSSGDGEGFRCGIAVFDHEKNKNWPTAWHIRDYGLFAPNNLYFKGPVTIKEGEKLEYRYRLFFHSGDVSAAELNNRYVTYLNA